MIDDLSMEVRHLAAGHRKDAPRRQSFPAAVQTQAQLLKDSMPCAIELAIHPV
jgi:hypothetical protein